MTFTSSLNFDNTHGDIFLGQHNLVRNTYSIYYNDSGDKDLHVQGRRGCGELKTCNFDPSTANEMHLDSFPAAAAAIGKYNCDNDVGEKKLCNCNIARIEIWYL